MINVPKIAFLALVIALSHLFSISCYAYIFYIDEFSVTKNGNLIFLDSFDDGIPPPDAPNYINGNPAEYIVTGTMGPEDEGKLTLDSTNAVTRVNPAGENVLFQGAVLKTNRDQSDLVNGLKIDDTFSVTVIFDLVAPGTPGDAYGVRFTDVIYANSPNQMVQLKVHRSIENELTITYQNLDWSAGTTTLIDEAVLDVSHDQIALTLARENLSSNAITASYYYIDGGIKGSTNTFANTADIFQGENFTRAQFITHTVEHQPIMYDEDKDWEIGDFELLDAIDEWAAGGLGDFELLDLIDYWAEGCYHWDTLTDQYKAGCVGILTYELPDTGQTESYSDTFGEDSDYIINPMSYTDNGNGTVTDNVTALMWQKEDDGEIYTWYEATGTYEATYNPGLKDVCGSLTLSGYTDWRLPSRKELITIVNYGNYHPAIDTTNFPNTEYSGYWTSTTAAVGTSYAWRVWFNSGSIADTNKQFSSYVRCVRGEHVSRPNFTDNGNDTVTDIVTGLTWQQDDDGAQRDWETAITYCEGLSLGGSSEWRLPNIKELESITDDSVYSPTIDTEYFPNTKATSYWSSTTGADGTSGAWVVGFGGGQIGTHSKTFDDYVRCVR